MPAIHLTVDIVVFHMLEDELHVLLVKRGYDPFKNCWALPGGFVEENEALDDAVIRELKEETSVTDVYCEQLYTFGGLGRDPRHRTVTVAYMALMPSDKQPQLEAGTDAADASWFKVKKLPKLAFDHADIVAYGMERLQNKLEWTTAGFKLLPKRFTLTQLQRVYESVLGRELDKRNFRRKVELLDVLDPLEKFDRSGSSRPARLYEFSEKRFEKLKDKGILFPF
ncbi:MAG: NUDIX hydrolase [Bdellovibrionales bacterium]|nr:NUDIX hydrolase [Bdellovibrionales bacterium]